MSHVREHRSVLAAAEARLLIALARQLPAWVNSDHLTFVALAAMIAAAWLLAAFPRAPWSAAAFAAALAINWFGDSLDGTLARVRNRQRPRYGYYVDHVVDLAGTAALLSGLAASALMTPALAFGALAAYAIVAAESYLATHARGMFRISFAGIGPTELRILFMVGVWRASRDPSIDVFGRPMLLFDVGGTAAIAGLTIAFVWSAVRNGRALYEEERQALAPDREHAA